MGFLKPAMLSLYRKVRVLYLCAQDPETPRMAKIIALLTVAYAVSPLDLIPDWIPILGYLDDLLIIPIGIGLVLWLTPRHVYDRHARGSADWVPDPKLKKVGRLIVLTGWALGGMIILNTLLPKY